MAIRTNATPNLIPQIDDLLELRHRANTLGLASRHQVNSLLCGLYASVFRGQGMDFEETREYQIGDEIRNMDWRVTARTGTPHMKVFREERERAVMLCVDSGPHMQFGTRGTFKNVQAARAAALLGWSAASNQDRVGALLFGDAVRGLGYYRPSRGRRALWRMLRGLTQAGGAGASPVAATAAEPSTLVSALDKLDRSVGTGSLAFIIADFNHDPAALELPLGRLRQRHEVVLVAVDDPADREIPAMGRMLFSTRDGQHVEVDTDDEAGRRQYREAWEQRRAALTALAARLKMDIITLRTNEEVHRALLHGLFLRAKRLGRP